MLGDDVQSYAVWEMLLARLNSHSFRLKLCPARLFASGSASPLTARLWAPRCNFTRQEKRLPQSMLSILFFSCFRPDLCRKLSVSDALPLGALVRAKTVP